MMGAVILIASQGCGEDPRGILGKQPFLSLLLGPHPHSHPMPRPQQKAPCWSGGDHTSSAELGSPLGESGAGLGPALAPEGEERQCETSGRNHGVKGTEGAVQRPSVSGVNPPCDREAQLGIWKVSLRGFAG